MAGSDSWNLFTDEQLIKLYEQGFNDREIAEKLGAAKRTVNGRRRSLGLKAHGHRLLFTDEQLIELHEQGFNDAKIGEKLGANHRIVGVRRRRLGLEAHGLKLLFTDKQLKDLHGQCLSDREIGEKLGVKINTVKSRRLRLGLKPILKRGITYPRRKRLFTDDQLIELYEQGLNDGEIGEKLGAKLSTVNKYRRKLGLKSIRARAVE